MTFFTKIPSPIAAAKEIYVPASILSGIISCIQPLSLVTPSIVILLVPSPWIQAPILFSILDKSMISGSFAALAIMVLPLAKVAANMILIVAPTEAKSK